MSPRQAFHPETFQFRGFHPSISIGMASDRYAGWIGQIYSRDRYTNGLSRRIHTVGGKPFTEEVLPVESVREYFEHFPVLEIDFTFYRLLREKSGEPTQNDHLLRQYRQHLKEGDRLILKVPQIISARRLRQGTGFAENEAYLNTDIFTHQFYEPALELLGKTLGGFIFEQEYHRKKDRSTSSQMASALDLFFGGIPRDKRYHVELRTEAYLSEPVFEVLEKRGVGLVLSHWTWLPPLWKQFVKAGSRFFNGGGDCIVRLITPLRTGYEESYAKAFPFDKLIDGMLDPHMIEETVRLMWRGIEQKMKMIIIINNRAGGNAPMIARALADKFLTVEP